MKTIKSKKSYFDFDDLFDDEELVYKKCKKKSKKSKKQKSSKKRKSEKKYKDHFDSKKINRYFFNLNEMQNSETKTNYKRLKHNYSKSFLGKVANCVNVDAKFRMDISDDIINNIVLIITGIIARLFNK